MNVTGIKSCLENHELFPMVRVKNGMLGTWLEASNLAKIAERGQIKKKKKYYAKLQNLYIIL